MPAVAICALIAAQPAGAFGGPKPLPDKSSGPESAAADRSAAPGIVLAQAAAPKASDFGGRKPNKGEKSAEQKKLDAEIAKKLRAARLAEIKKKLTTISLLIQSVNVRLDLMTAVRSEFEQKRSLENQLRDLITLAALTGRAVHADRALLARYEEAPPQVSDKVIKARQAAAQG